jgi:hypothetical protein
MATKKTAVKKAAAPKAAKTGAARTRAAKPAAARETDASANVETIMKRIQDGFKEAGAALATSGHVMDEKRREILVTLIENAQANTDATFTALRNVMEAESIGESLRIQREALRDGIERNLAQVRDVAALAAQSGRQTIEPVTEYITNLRGKVRIGARN